jgi:hypothetical protein
MPNISVPDLSVSQRRSWKDRIRRLMLALPSVMVSAAIAFFAHGQRNIFRQYHRIDHENPPDDRWI